MKTPLVANIKRIFLLPKKAWVFIVCALFVGGFIGHTLAGDRFQEGERSVFDLVRPVRLSGNNYKFISPLLGYSVPNITQFNPFQPLEAKVSNLLSQQKAAGILTDGSVYFRDLTSGRWVGVNENQKYSPASMMKVVVMIAYFKYSQTDPAVLSKRILYTQAMDDTISDVPFQASSTLEVGKTYTVEELIESMISSSDNGAKNALLDNINSQALNETYTDLGIDIPDDNNDYTISAKTYSVFFRILYNATYINHDLSEKALELLSQTQYKDGLVAGVPAGVPVAQKFGEHIDTDSSGNATGLELHDCGIIYHIDRPYALCVMTQGTNLKNLTASIKDLSALVYKAVNEDYK